MIEKLSRHVKSKDKTLVFQYECLINLKTHLEKSLPGRSYAFRDEDEELFFEEFRPYNDETSFIRGQCE